ncbi:hypothetical protein J2Z83_001700 [Virgibacillus natechei]|uniref:Uncharacterized protein n=1 Tax=Virgibacillus natechei TaxID=1216297 RepID=A0ABS4IFG5_9BACI|nr:hypothetical protein [Virgibacillus natechei]
MLIIQTNTSRFVMVDWSGGPLTPAGTRVFGGASIYAQSQHESEDPAEWASRGG